MRGFLGILLFFALVGICGGMLTIFTRAFGTAASLSEAAIVGLFPMLIGVISLSGATIVLAIDEARRDQLIALGKIAQRLGADQ